MVDDASWTVHEYHFAYEYNRDGSLKSETYPSGKKIDHGYDSAGRVYSTSLHGASSNSIAQS